MSLVLLTIARVCLPDLPLPWGLIYTPTSVGNSHDPPAAQVYLTNKLRQMNPHSLPCWQFFNLGSLRVVTVPSLPCCFSSTTLLQWKTNHFHLSWTYQRHLDVASSCECFRKQAPRMGIHSEQSSHLGPLTQFPCPKR